MSLQDLENSLYKKDSDIQERRKKLSQFNPENTNTKPQEMSQKVLNTILTEDEEKHIREKRRKIIFGGVFGVLGIIVIALLAFFWSMFDNSAFDQENVALALEGSDTVDNNNEVEFVLHYTNDNRAKLENAVLKIHYPENFIPAEGSVFQKQGLTMSTFELGEIGSHDDGMQRFRGRFLGTSGEIIQLQAELVYSPSNSSVVYTAMAQKPINVSASALEVHVLAPLELIDGDEVEYRIEYTNSGMKDLYSSRLQLTYPRGFHFVSAEPKVSEGENIWYLGTLGQNDEGVVRVRGVLNGSRNEEKPLTAAVGFIRGDGEFVPYAEAKELTKIVSSPLAITQTVSQQYGTLTVSSDEGLRYRLNFENEGDTGLQDVIITVQFFGDIFDFSRLSTGGGYFDQEQKIITWRASDSEQLATLLPGQTGSLAFEIPVLKNIPVESDNDKHFTGYTVATIDSPNVPENLGAQKVIGKDQVNYKLNTDVILGLDIFEKDTRQKLSEFPLEEGQEVTYEVHAKVSNLYNDVREAGLDISIPSAVTWDEVQNSDESGQVSFEERTHKIHWNLGTLPHATGVLAEPRELVFDIKITPQVNQKGQEIVLLRDIGFTATDVFTEEPIRVTVDDVETPEVKKE